jgi:FkbM family methyltransferase
MPLGPRKRKTVSAATPAATPAVPPTAKADTPYAAAIRLYETGKVAEALAAFERAMEAAPNDPDIRIGLGACLRKLDRLRDAEAAYGGALALAPNRSAAWGNLGNVLKDMDKDDAAIAAHARALALEPENPRLMHNMGIALAHANRHAEAVAMFDRSLARQADNADVAWDRARSLLYLGRFAEGWDAYEARWGLPSHRHTRVDATREWDGTPFPGKTLLLYCEQGFGDTIQCLRHLPQVKALGGRVVVQCQPELRPLAQMVAGIDELVDKGTAPPPFDICLSLLSLPRFFARNEAAITGAPYLHTPPDRRGKFAHLFPADTLNVGIVWSGSPTFKGNKARAVTLALLRRAVDGIPNVRLYSLQKGPGEAELHALGPRANMVDLAPHINDFGDTAAILDQLDLVVMTDSSVCHLAGAMGRPVWVLLGAACHWLWRDKGDTTPWYDSMRFYRQHRPGEWPALMERVRSDLETLAARKQPGRGAVAAAPAAALQVPPLESRRMAVVPTRHGPMMINKFDAVVGRSLALYGEYCPAETRLLRGLIRPGDVVVDVGANMGAHTLAFAQAVGPSGLVHAFEPQQALAQLLGGTLTLNDMDWVRCHHAAAGARPGWGVVPPVDYGAPGAFSELALARGGDGQRVEVVPLDSLDLPRCSLVKIDVAGMETEVIDGARALIARHRPMLYVDNNRRDRSPELLRLLAALGYQAWWHLAPLFAADNHAGHPQNVFGKVLTANLLCLPLGAVLKGIPTGVTLRPVKGADDWWA